MSVSDLVRRAYDLDCISEASFERACIYLNKTGERLQERHEPVPEHPVLLELSMEALNNDPDLTPLAVSLSWGRDKLEAILATTRPRVV